MSRGDRCVVGELEERALDALGAALGFLHAEDVLVEELLELLVGEVDQELLEAVAREALEAEDVEEADGALRVPDRRGGRRHQAVDPGEHPSEERAVQGLGESVARSGRLGGWLGHLDHGELADALDGECRGERAAVEAEQLGGAREARRARGVGGRAVVLLCELHRREAEVAQVEHGRKDAAHRRHLVRRGDEALQRRGGDAPVCRVVDAGQLHARRLAQVAEVHRRQQLQRRALGGCAGGRAELVEHVVVALARGVLGHTRLLEEVGGDARCGDEAGGVELDLSPLAEAAAVAVAHGLGVAEGLEHRVGLQQSFGARVRGRGRG